ncbi:hypothetical protein C8A03DRAFT_35286 [Achaetomium macrosporum]|uniref:PUA-like domain protein n=1 Tax=Achaetomium macrosporum TaxID=79813 RepID=A0AAN7C7E2_9PEZI|nr:hypothetical protein C8A03DRAFT_35286 [Achaetomium macrosporum]
MAPSRPELRQATLDNHFRQSTNRISKKPHPHQAEKSQSAARPAAKRSGGDRVLTDVLLAIKPVHLANIASRQKNHEYRKYRLRDGVTRLWFYETGDEGGRSAITHIAVIPASVRRTPGSVPTEPFGIGNDDFNAGRKESKYGYPIVELYELVKPVRLTEMKRSWGLGAPMGWRYVGSDLWEDRWGGDHKNRDSKVRKVF